MPTYNSWNILTLPSSPAAPRSIEWSATDTVSMSTNPFTGQQQTYDWQSSWLEASVQYSPMTNAQAQAWIAFLMSLRGGANIFQMGDPLNVGPQNASAVAPLVSGANQKGYTLITTGGSNLTVGDWIQLGYHLHRLTSVAGNVLGIWPCLRESPSSGSSVVIRNCMGIWRLKSNDRTWSVRETKLYGISFEIREAL